MTDVKITLLEMGFDQNKIERAIAATKNGKLEQCMDWILSHSEDDEPISNNSGENVDSQSSAVTSPPTGVVVKSIKCEQCNKIFATQAEVEFHANKSGHNEFSESTEEKATLTEEQKREQLERLEAKLKQRRLEREAKERAEATESERNRIRSGREILRAKDKYEEVEQRRLVEQRKREKEEDRQAKQRVRDQIEQDKLARRAKQQPSSSVQTPPKSPQTVVTNGDNSNVKAPHTTINYTEVKLQIRMTDGSTLQQTFGIKEPLSAVRLYVEMNRKDDTGPFKIKKPCATEAFQEDDYQCPLETLDLAPRATLIISKV